MMEDQEKWTDVVYLILMFSVAADLFGAGYTHVETTLPSRAQGCHNKFSNLVYLIWFSQYEPPFSAKSWIVHITYVQTSGSHTHTRYRNYKYTIAPRLKLQYP